MRVARGGEKRRFDARIPSVAVDLPWTCCIRGKNDGQVESSPGRTWQRLERNRLCIKAGRGIFEHGDCM